MILWHNKNMCTIGSYIAIDLKSFYASVECVDRGLDPLSTNLVVADEARSEKTICLAVSPSLKAHGIGGRPRLFEVVQKVQAINAKRMRKAQRPRTGPPEKLTYITAKPRMARYLEVSTQIYEVYLRYFAPEDIHVYSIDEVLIDASKYLRTYGKDARELASDVVAEVYASSGITATAGIGTNLYLAKVAMDILAKHEEPDARGVRVAVLDENAYKRRLWSHVPLTDFWRVGPGYARKLAAHGMHTMGDVARCSLGEPNTPHSEDLLFRLFGKNAELLIDHAWGVEPVTMEDVKRYAPASSSKVSGQVLQRPYHAREGRLVMQEMADELAFDLMGKGLATDKVTITVGYDRESLLDPSVAAVYEGKLVTDHYGRTVPKHAHGTLDLGAHTASAHRIVAAALALYDKLVDPRLLVRRINVAAEHVLAESEAAAPATCEQMALFADGTCEDARAQDAPKSTPSACGPMTPEQERQLQKAMLDIRERFGKNAVLRAASLQEEATARQRNAQIGGHSA